MSLLSRVVLLAVSVDDVVIDRIDVPFHRTNSVDLCRNTCPWGKSAARRIVEIPLVRVPRQSSHRHQRWPRPSTNSVPPCTVGVQSTRPSIGRAPSRWPSFPHDDTIPVRRIPTWIFYNTRVARPPWLVIQSSIAQFLLD